MELVYIVEVFRKDTGDWIDNLAEFATEPEAWAFARTCTPERLSEIFDEDGALYEVRVCEATITFDGEIIYP